MPFAKGILALQAIDLAQRRCRKVLELRRVFATENLAQPHVSGIGVVRRVPPQVFEDLDVSKRRLDTDCVGAL